MTCRRYTVKGNNLCLHAQRAYQSCHCPQHNTSRESRELDVACATTASPMRPERRTSNAYKTPAMVAGSQRPPCINPNSNDEIATAAHPADRNAIDSKSGLTR